MKYFMNIRAAGLVIAMMATPAAAWERTTHTATAPGDVPLVLMIAESGDVLGEPWLEYLISIGYDVSGSWWNETAQTLLDYNPDATFVPGTNYGVAAGSYWWIPDMTVVQETVSTSEAEAQPVDADPVMRQSDFVALTGALAADVAAMEQFQEQSIARLSARLGTIEAAQAVATVNRTQMSSDIDANAQAIAQTQSAVDEVAQDVVAMQESVDSAVNATQSLQESVAATVIETEALRESVAEAEVANESIVQAVDSYVARFTIAMCALGVALLLFGGGLWSYINRQVRLVRNEVTVVADVANEAKAKAEEADAKATLVCDVLLGDLLIKGGLPTEAELMAIQRKGGSIELNLSKDGYDCRLVICQHKDVLGVQGLRSRPIVPVTSARSLTKTISRALRLALEEKNFPHHFPGVNRRSRIQTAVAA